MAKNYGSAVFQVKSALQAVFTPGDSRHLGKQDGTAAEHIYSIGAMKTYLSANIVFAKWVRVEFNEKFIGGINSEMVEQFIRSLHDRDLSHATINKYVAAIAKLAFEVIPHDPARVEFVSPYTTTQSGFSAIMTGSRAISIRPVISPWPPPLTSS